MIFLLSLLTACATYAMRLPCLMQSNGREQMFTHEIAPAAIVGTTESAAKGADVAMEQARMATDLHTLAAPSLELVWQHIMASAAYGQALEVAQ